MPRSMQAPRRTRANVCRSAGFLAIASFVLVAACDEPIAPDRRSSADSPRLATASTVNAPTDLGTFGGHDSDAQDVNDDGLAVGGAAVPSAPGTFLYHAFVWQNGSKTDLTPTAVYDSRAYGINDVGQIVGYRSVGATPGSADWRATLWEQGSEVTLSSASSIAWDVNEAGQIVGEADVGGGVSHAVLWTRAAGTWTMTDLDPGGASSIAYAINEVGQVVGAKQLSNGQTHAALWQNGVVTDLGTLAGSSYSTALGVNDLGEAVGFCRDGQSHNRACLWPSGGAATDLGTLSAAADAFSTAYDISNAGQVVGEGPNANGELRGILWEGGSMTELDPIGTTAGSNSRAFAISDQGHVAGESFTPALGGSHAALWTLTIHYQFSGFFQPVDNPGLEAPFVVNRAKAGSAIPVKFSLGGDEGLAIFNAGYPKAVAYDCSSGALLVDPIEQTVTADANRLTYDPVSGRYTYVWKTEKALANSCRKLLLGLRDGSQHYALFTFVR